MAVVIDYEPPVKWIALQQKSLDDDRCVPRLIKWLLRWIYNHYGWAATDHDGHSYCKLEFRGTFDNEADARWAASCPGGSYRSLPHNAALPEETCQFGVHDFPLSSASPGYRHRSLPFITVPRADFEALGEQIKQVLHNTEDPIATV